MAITVAVDTVFNQLAGKTLSPQSELISRVKETTATITFGASDTYTTGGVVVDLSFGGRIKTILDVVFVSNTKGLLLQYVPATASAAATGKVKAYGADPGAAGGAVVALPELANSSGEFNSLIIKARVRGY